jgi:hypothetical protein
MTTPVVKTYFEYINSRGAKYYYDTRTGTTTFKFPADALIFDPETHEILYTPPDLELADKKEAAASSGTEPEVRTASAQSEAPNTGRDAPEAAGESGRRVWLEYTNKKGVKYYYNTETRVTTFKFPMDDIIVDPKTRDVIHAPAHIQVTVNERAGVRNFDSMRQIRVVGGVRLLEDPSTKSPIAVKKRPASLLRGIDSLVGLVHCCLLPIVGYSLSPPEVGTIWAANGSLRDALTKTQTGARPPFMDATGIAIIVCGVVHGMRFLHSRGVLHRNLKPENILIDERGWPLIGDVGAPADPLGPYAAPELHDGAAHTEDSDVFAFALVLYEILVGQPAFPLGSDYGTLRARLAGGERPEVSAAVNRAARRIIKRGWSADPDIRPTFDEILFAFDQIKFEVVGGVDGRRVSEFSSVITKSE